MTQKRTTIVRDGRMDVPVRQLVHDVAVFLAGMLIVLIGHLLKLM